MEKIEQIYEELTGNDNFAKWGVDKAIQALGILIDASCDLSKTEGLKHAIKQAEKLLSENLTEIQKTTSAVATFMLVLSINFLLLD